jgi:hypothetical protein
MEDDLKKMEDNLKTKMKMKDDLKKKRCKTTSKKMEDDLPKKWKTTSQNNGRRPQNKIPKNGRRTKKNEFKTSSKKKKNGGRPQNKIEKNKIISY